MTASRWMSIVSFEPPFKHKTENKKWIRTAKIGKKGRFTPPTSRYGLSHVRGVSPELRRFYSIVCWVTSSSHLRPFFHMFFARIERMIHNNGSTHTFKYLKECMRITVRCLAGTPHLRGSESNPAIFIRLDRFGLPTILPLQLREEIRRYIASVESGLGVPFVESG
jgi:hypothetical protein